MVKYKQTHKEVKQHDEDATEKGGDTDRYTKTSNIGSSDRL